MPGYLDENLVFHDSAFTEQIISQPQQYINLSSGEGAYMIKYDPTVPSILIFGAGSADSAGVNIFTTEVTGNFTKYFRFSISESPQDSGFEYCLKIVLSNGQTLYVALEDGTTGDGLMFGLGPADNYYPTSLAINLTPFVLNLQ